MASKKDLVEAQAFSRRRLLTAFVSGTPGGRELEPTKPMRAVVGGVTLAVLLVLGSLGFGLLRPGLPAGWDDNRLVVTGDGARYVALDGTLHPVLNTASARLLVPPGQFDVVQVRAEQVADSPRGVTVGIPGAPDAIPEPDRLIGSGWIACVGTTGSTLTVLTGELEDVAAQVRTRSEVGGPSPALLVEAGGDLYLVAEGRRHLIPRAETAGVLRAVGQETVLPWDVTGRWLNLFAPGADLSPVVVDGAGDPLPAGSPAPPGAVVGSVLVVTGGADGERRYVVDAQGELAPLTPFATPLYGIGSGAVTGAEIEVTAAQVSGMRTAAEPAAPADWPTEPGQIFPAEATPCAYLDPEHGVGVHLVGLEDLEMNAVGDEVQVDPARGALVRADAGGAPAGSVHLVDQTGVAYPVPTAGDELSRLGFEAEDVSPVPQPWLALLPTGPELTVGAAAQSPTAGPAEP